MLLTLLVLALQAGGAAPEAPARRGRPVCARVRVSAPSLPQPPRDLVFSTRLVLDLRFDTWFLTPPRGDHVLRLKLLTPAGFLYQEVSVPFRGPGEGGSSSPPTRVVPGQPAPLPVQALAPVTEGTTTAYSVGASVPVAGTSITQSSLYGRWTVEPFLDDEAEACGPPTRFTIRE